MGRRWAGFGAVLLTTVALAVPAAAESVAAEPREAPVEVGQAAPDFQLTAEDGKVYRLGEMEDRKSRVLVFFRGTW